MLLKDCATIKGGKRLPKGQTLQGEKNSHPYIRVKDMQKRYVSLSDDYEYVPNNIFPSISRYIVNTGDVILSIVGTVGLVALVDKSLNNANLTENCVKLVNIKNFLEKYVYYYLISKSGQAQIQAGIVGSTQPKFPLYNIEKIEIPDVSMSEQQHIVDILGTLDEKIENNEKNIALMLQLCKEKFSLLSSQSNIKTTLKNLCEFAICGTTPSTKAPELWNGNIPFITTPDMNNKVFVFDTERTVAYSDKIKSKLISEDSISVSCIGTIGVIGMATELSLTNQQINTLIPRTNQKYYLYNLLLANIDAIKAIATGSATPNISKESFLKLEVYVCSEKDICSFNEDVTPIYETIKKLQIENRKIKELKQLYLKKFFG